MTVGSGINTYANSGLVDNEFSKSVIVTDSGFSVGGRYYTKAEFEKVIENSLRIESSLEVKNDSLDTSRQRRMAGIGIAAGTYFVPIVGIVVITVAGALLISDVVVDASSWMYETVTNYLSTAKMRKIAKIKAKIPSRIRDENGDVDLGSFDQKVNGQKRVAYKEKGGWTIEKDNTQHGGRKWKLKNKSGGRVASLDENGKVLSD